MGKLILCTGNIASQPYQFKSSGVQIYSMEELCYYIYHNVDTITEDLFGKDLIHFIKEELGLKDRAEYLESLIDKKVGIKDLVVSIFCSTDYYSEEEIKGLLKEIDKLYSLTPVQRKKRHADYCFTKEQFKEAMKEYRALISSKEIRELNTEEYGDILHNMAVLQARMGAFTLAAEGFREAYERNGRKESLKQYLYALRLGKKEPEFEREMKLMVANQALYEEMEKELFQVVESEEHTASYHEVLRLFELRELGKMKEYYQLAEQILEELKKNYRSNSI